MALEIVSGSHIVTTSETLIATLTEWHPSVSVYVDPKGDPNAVGTLWRVYAVAGGVRTLLDEGQFTVGPAQGQRVLNAVPGAGATIALYAVTAHEPTASPLTAVIVGYNLADDVTPQNESDTGTHPVTTGNTTFATLSQWYPIVDVQIDASAAGTPALGTTWEVVASFPSVAGFAPCVVASERLTELKETLFQSIEGGAETYFLRARTSEQTTGNVTAVLSGHAFQESGIVPTQGILLTAAITFTKGTAFRTTTGGQAGSATARPRDLSFTGVALDNVAAGHKGGFCTTGPIDPAIFTLGAGTAVAVGIDAGGICIRADDVNCASAPNWVGYCNVDGVVTVAPVLREFFDPRDFGAVKDSVQNDSAAYAAMIASGPASGTMYVKDAPGVAFIDSPIVISPGGRQVVWISPGGGNPVTPCGFRYPPDCPAAFILGNGANDGDISEISNVYLEAQAPLRLAGPGLAYGITKVWTAHTFYAKGDVVTDPGGVNPTQYWISSGGTTGAAIPPLFVAALSNPGVQTGTDGTIAHWTAGRCVVQLSGANDGQAVVVGQRFMTSGANNDNTYMYKVTVAGNLGVFATQWAPDGTLYPPVPFVYGTATLIAEVQDGIQVKTRAEVHRIYGRGQLNAIVRLQGSLPGDNASPSQSFVSRIRGDRPGLGVYISGSDANGISVRDADTLFVGALLPGNGGHTLVNRAHSNFCSHIVSQDGTGKAVLNENGFSIVCDNIDSENALASQIDNPAVFLGSGGAAGMGASTGFGFGPAPAARNVQIYNNRTGATGVYAGLDSSPSTNPVLNFLSSDDENSGTQLLGWSYQKNLHYSFLPAPDTVGRYWFTYGPQYNLNTMFITGRLAAEGAGNFGIGIAFFCGLASPYIKGVDAAALTTTSLRDGHFLAGDRFEFIGTGVAGTWNEKIVTVAGFAGQTWVSLNYTTTANLLGVPRNIVIPTDPTKATQRWRATAGPGTPSVVEPPWTVAPAPGDTVVDAAGTTWTFVGSGPVYSWGSFIDDPVFSLIPQTRSLRSDTANTDAATAAPKEQLASFSLQPANTTTNVAGQVLATIDATFLNLPAGALPDNSVYQLDLVILAKSPAGHAEAGGCKLSGTFYRDGGALTRIGADVNSPNYLGGTTNALVISANTIQIQATPGVNSTVEWGIEGQLARRKD